MRKFTTGQRLKEIMDTRGIRQIDILNRTTALEESLGAKISKSHLSNYVSDRSAPDNSKLTLLAQALEVSEPWLMGYDVDTTEASEKGSNSDESNFLTSYRKLTQPRKESVRNYLNTLLTEQNNIFKSPEVVKKSKNVSPVPKKESNVLTFNKKDGITIYPNVIGAAAGVGTSHYADSDFDEIMIPNDEVYEEADVVPMYVRGDSMEPKYFDGDIIWIDTSDKSINIHQIGVFDTIDGRVVKKMGVDELISINSDYPDIELNEHMELSTVGKVIDVIRKEQINEWQNATWV